MRSYAIRRLKNEKSVLGIGISFGSFLRRRKEMKKVSVMMVVGLVLCSSNLFADFVTGFEASDGYSDGNTIVGIQNWENTGAGTNSRGIATSSPVPPGANEGSLFARVKDWNNTDGTFSSEFSEEERIGSEGQTYTCYVTVWMSAHTTHSGMGLFYVQGSGHALVTDTAAVFGFWNSSFTYNTGGSYVSTGSFTPDVWYKFEAVLYGDGNGNGTWDLTISEGDLSEPIVRTNLTYRAGHHGGSVPYIGCVSMFSSKGSGNASGMNADDGDIYFDGISVTPEPTIVMILLLGAGFARLVRYR